MNYNDRVTCSGSTHRHLKLDLSEIYLLFLSQPAFSGVFPISGIGDTVFPVVQTKAILDDSASKSPHAQNNIFGIQPLLSNGVAISIAPPTTLSPVLLQWPSHLSASFCQSLKTVSRVILFRKSKAIMSLLYMNFQVVSTSLRTKPSSSRRCQVLHDVLSWVPL